MSEVWWGKEADKTRRPRIIRSQDQAAAQPQLLSPSRNDVTEELLGRRQSFTPDWTNARPTDAGIALVKLFGEAMEPVLERLNRLPEKAFVDFLDLAGVSPFPARPAAALLEFEVSENAPQSISINRGFQVGARPANGQGDLVIFETVQSLFAAPAKIAEMHTQQENAFDAVDLKSSFQPFGNQPIAGNALLIGLSGVIEPGPTISLGLRIDAPADAPPPVPFGGIGPSPTPPPASLEWSVLDEGRFEAAEIISDETGGLLRSGVIELQLPARWRPSFVGGQQSKEPLRWLRVRLTFGAYENAPRLAAIRLNMVRAIAARTIYNEALEPILASRGRQWRLSQRPVLPDSLIIDVDDGGFDTNSAPEINATSIAEQTGDAQGDAAGTQKFKTRRWRQVPELASRKPDDEVYVLDPLSGVVTFGDGKNGAQVPQGFRNVRATSYRVGGGAAGTVPAGAISVKLSSASFVTKVGNPWPATGGSDRETQQQTLKRGPQQIRARGRAVTVADYELLAMNATGALVERAHAVAGLHPLFPGQPIPGVVGIFVVPPAGLEGIPTPNEDTLRAVAKYLSEEAAPAGVEIVATVPRYHRIRIEAEITVIVGEDATDVVRRVLKELDRYLHPLTGGEDGAGWPFGGPLHHQALIRLLTAVAGVSDVSNLNIIADGIRRRDCNDFTPAAHALLWPEVHQIIAKQRGGQ
jgi:predicted phage baseplate assembly protein